MAGNSKNRCRRFSHVRNCRRSPSTGKSADTAAAHSRPVVTRRPKNSGKVTEGRVKEQCGTRLFARKNTLESAEGTTVRKLYLEAPRCPGTPHPRQGPNAASFSLFPSSPSPLAKRVYNQGVETPTAQLSYIECTRTENMKPGRPISGTV